MSVEARVKSMYDDGATNERVAEFLFGPQWAMAATPKCGWVLDGRWRLASDAPAAPSHRFWGWRVDSGYVSLVGSVTGKVAGRWDTPRFNSIRNTVMGIQAVSDPFSVSGPVFELHVNGHCVLVGRAESNLDEFRELILEAEQLDLHP